jgi:hypothetical protein
MRPTAKAGPASVRRRGAPFASWAAAQAPAPQARAERPEAPRKAAARAVAGKEPKAAPQVQG